MAYRLIRSKKGSFTKRQLKPNTYIFRLEFHLRPVGTGYNLVIKMPITIGTVPLAISSSNEESKFTATGIFKKM